MAPASRRNADYAVDLSVPGNAPKADRAELEHSRRPTKMLPTDGIVKATATEITSSAKTDLEKARAIYEWIVDNTFRDPAKDPGLIIFDCVDVRTLSIWKRH
jgi:hypothetical protein